MKGKAQQTRKVHRKEFAEGDTVYLRLYEDPRGQWAPGVVIRRLGAVLYDVRSSNKIVRRHANQLRPRSVDDALNVILETFNLPLLPLSKPHMEPGSSNPVATDSVTRDEEDVLAGPEQTPRANSLISPEQHGFLNSRSTCTNLIECTNDWPMSMHQGTYIIYFDFKKAFDSVSHQKLIKLQAYGISDNLLSWLEAFLSNRTHAVKVKGHLSDSGYAISGVPKGVCSDPRFSDLFIYNKADTLINNYFKFKLFTDNVKLYSKSSFPQNSSLQTTINGLELWSNKWQLQIAPEKCIQISIKTSRIKTPPSNYTIASQTLPLSDNTRDLGVLIDNKLTYKAHINTIVHKSYVRLRLLKCFHTRDKNILTSAYCT